MAIRQYIGARYTTKVYENALDPSSAEWQSGVAYEPLTLVTYNNSSYLSKKQVGAGVGNPAANPAYWVCTGYYNGQIINLQNQIDSLSDALSDYENENAGNIIAISDSYNNKYPDTTGNTMWEYLVSYAGYTGDKFRGYAYSGSGFCRNEGNGTFYDNIQNIAASLTSDERAAIGLIIVAAGRNDWNYTYTDVINAIKTFVTYCKSTFPNASVKLGYIANFTNDQTNTTGSVAQNHITFTAYRDCAWAGASYLSGLECVLKDSSLMASDWIHPNYAGRYMLAQAIYNAIENGSVNIDKDAITVTINYTHAGITNVGQGAESIYESAANNMLVIRPISDIGVISFAYDTLTSTGGKFTAKLGELPHATNGFVNYPLFDVDLPLNKMYITGWVDSVTPDSTLHECGGKLTINSSGEIILHIYAPSLGSFKISNVYFFETKNVIVPLVDC